MIGTLLVDDKELPWLTNKVKKTLIKKDLIQNKVHGHDKISICKTCSKFAVTQYVSHSKYFTILPLYRFASPGMETGKHCPNP